MHKEYFIKDIAGVMYYKDMPLFEFSIVNRELVHFKDLSGGEYWPLEPREYGATYSSLNEFFQRRVVPDYAQDIKEYLEAIGLEQYNFDELVKRNNGNNHVDNYWVKFNNIGAKCWEDIIMQHYPIYS